MRERHLTPEQVRSEREAYELDLQLEREAARDGLESELRLARARIAEHADRVKQFGYRKHHASGMSWWGSDERAVKEEERILAYWQGRRDGILEALHLTNSKGDTQ